MIVRDEAQILPDFLAASQGLYDELCVVDTGSTDETVALLEAAGARIEHMEWQDDFSAARNKSLQMATSTHVLVLDADEFASPNFIVEVRQMLDKQHIGAACINMVNPMPHGSRSRSALLRFFVRDPSIQYEYPIHEDPSRSVLQVLTEKNLALATTQTDVTHWGYTEERATARDKKVRDTTILWRCVDDDPTDLYSWFKLLEQGRFWADPMLTEQAAEGGLLALSELQEVPSSCVHFVGEMVVMLVTAQREHDQDEAAALLHKWCERLPNDVGLTLYRAQWREELGALDLAKFDYLHCLQLQSTTTKIHLAGVRPRLGLARVAIAEGNLNEALDLVDAAIRLQPREPEALLALASLSGILGGPEASERVADAYVETYGDGPERHAAWGEAALLSGAYDDAVRSLETACAQNTTNGAYAALLARARSAGDVALP